MRRLMLVMLGALAVIASLVPAARASTLTVRLSVAPQTMTRHITLPQHDCAASLGRASSCAMSESIHLSRSTSTGDFYEGYLQACAVTYTSGGCNTHYWWVKDSFNFTATASQAWDNGTPSCSASPGLTNVTWCSYVNNGTNSFEEGFNFGNGGWARADLTASLFYNAGACTGVRGPSWANVSGWALDEAINAFYECYPE